MSADREDLERLQFRLKSLLPEDYRHSYEEIQPVSMGSAGLKFDSDGKVAWDEIWGSFCDLAMAGGPPHKGALLGPGTRPEIEADPIRYEEVVEEICRGISMASELPAQVSPRPGWVRVDCYSEAMAGWLLRAIVMENVAVRLERRAIDLPAAPRFRLEKEIKNVVTVIAKTAHYWVGHMPRSQRHTVAVILAEMARESPVVVPGEPDDGPGDERPALASRMTQAIERDSGPKALTTQPYPGWLGVTCPDVSTAVWMMRMLVGTNVLSRREGAVLFVPVNPTVDPDGERVRQALSRVRRLEASRPLARITQK